MRLTPDMSIVTDELKSFIANFGKQYTKALAVAIVNDCLSAESKCESKETPRQLKHDVPVAPELEGVVGVSDGEKKEKPKYWRVDKEWNIEVWESKEAMDAAAGDESKKTKDIFCPWGYWPYYWAGPSDGKNPKRRGGPQWILDADRDGCSKCQAKFNITKHKHHCRTCGEIFCSDCCYEKWPLYTLGYSGPELVCETCFQVLETKGLDSFTYPEPQETLGLRMSHTQRKTRFIVLEDNKQRNAWYGAIRTCSRFAKPPVNPNKMLAIAFGSAHKYCWNYNGPWWRWWKIFGDEVEMLTVLAQFIIRERCVERVIRGMGFPSFIAKKAGSELKCAIDDVVSNTVSASWPPIVAAAEKSEAVVRTALEPLLQPIGEQKQKLMDNLREQLGSAINTAIASVAQPLMEKVLPMVFGPLLNVHVQCYKTFKDSYDSAKQECTRNQCNNERDYHYRIRSAASGTYWKVSEIGHTEMDPMVELLRALGSVPPFNYLYPAGIANSITNNARELLNDAMFTMEKDEEVVKVLDQGGAAAAAMLSERYADISQKYLADSKTVVKETMVDILWQLIGTPILKTTLSAPGVEDLIKAADDLIPDAMKDFLSISAMFEELVVLVLTDVINEQVANNTESSMAKLDAGFEAYAAPSSA
jgi:hypothetical protein